MERPDWLVFSGTVPSRGVYICNKRVVSGIIILACTQRLALFSGGSLGTSKDLKSYE